MSKQVLWSGITRFHDWMGGNRKIPFEILKKAEHENLINKIDWIMKDPEDKKEMVNNQNQILGKLLSHRPKKNNLFRIGAGGNYPSTWNMTLGLFPFNNSTKMVEGYNILNLWFEMKEYESIQKSNELIRVFKEIHTIENTEFAFIHPYDDFEGLTHPTEGEYQDPITIGPMFSGVYWAIFLGTGHLQRFDLKKLEKIQVFEKEWYKDKGLFIRCCQNIADISKPEYKKEILNLTEEFRAALNHY